MALTDNLVAQFVKITNDNNQKTPQTTAYGKVVVIGNQTYVRLDGSDILTPVTTTVEVKNEDRVAVSIENHTAVITGNVTDPSASSENVAGFFSEVIKENNRIAAQVGAIDGSLTQLELLHNQMSVQVENSAGEISRLTQTANEFDISLRSKVDDDSIIASINASTEGIKINANKVNITGVVTFNDLKNEGSTVINGSNVTGGTITGALLQTATLTETSGVSIGTDSVKIGCAGFFFDSSRFALQCKKNVAFSSMGSITIMAGLNADGTTSDQGMVYIPGSTLQVQRLTVVGNASVQGGLAVSGALSSSSISVTNSVAATNGFTSSSGGVYVSGSITTTGGGINAQYGNITSGETVQGKNIKATNNVNCVGLGVSGDMSVSNNAYIKYLYVNGTWVSSDAKLKTDIRYLGVDDQTIGESGLMAPNTNITTGDMHTFVETLPLTSYRLKSEVDEGVDRTYYSFIAQDLLYTKVGSELIDVFDDEGNMIKDGVYDNQTLKYSESKLIMFVCGALQEEIKQRKALERKLDAITNEILD